MYACYTTVGRRRNASRQFIGWDCQKNALSDIITNAATSITLRTEGEWPGTRLPSRRVSEAQIEHERVNQALPSEGAKPKCRVPANQPIRRGSAPDGSFQTQCD
jgi:hypothetical protein